MLVIYCYKLWILHKKNMNKMSFFAHETAIVEKGSQIGEGTKVWHFSHIMPEAQIGKDCNIGQNVFIASRVVIGNNNKIQNNVSIYEGLESEDDVFFGPSAVFTNVVNPRSHVIRKTEYQKTILRKGATIGANATVICGVTIGRYAFIGAGAVITKDVLDYALMIGVPARQDGWMSQHGCRLTFDKFSLATCAESGEKYRLLDGICRKLD